MTANDRSSPYGMARMWHVKGHPRPCRDRFRSRERYQPLMISYLCPELLHVVHVRPPVSVAVRRDRYSVGYSVARVVWLTACGLPALGSGRRGVARALSAAMKSPTASGFQERTYAPSRRLLDRLFDGAIALAWVRDAGPASGYPRSCSFLSTASES